MSLLTALTLLVATQASLTVPNFETERRAAKDPEAFAVRVRGWFGADGLKAGRAAKTDGLQAVWAIEAPGERARFLPDGGKPVNLRRLGRTNVWTGVANYKPNAAFRWAYEVDGKRVGGGDSEFYEIDPDTREQAGVPKGKLTERGTFESRVFAGTKREWWVYQPAGPEPVGGYAILYVQDGQWLRFGIPTVLDNLIAKRQIPPTIAVFLTPGTFEGGRSNRSHEYDRLSPDYARMLIDEIHPLVAAAHRIRPEPEMHATLGISSGGICAFTAAWERPDIFGRVISWVGSFTNIQSGPTGREGGHNYPALLRKAPKKPIRVYLQDGEGDLDNEHGNWPLGNHQMAKSLAFRGYDYQFVMGNGFHNDRQGRALLPSTLRWLFR